MAGRRKKKKSARKQRRRGAVRRSRKTKAAAARRRRRLRYEKREAKRVGLSHREWVHQRAERERAYRKKIAGMSDSELMRMHIISGALDTDDPGILAVAGLTAEEAKRYSQQALVRDHQLAMAERKR